MATIFDITAEMNDLLKQAEENNWDPVFIKDTLESLGFEDKVNDYLRVIADKEAIAAALKEEKIALGKRQAVFENEAKRMKDALLLAMQGIDATTIKAPLGTITRKLGGVKVAIRESEITDDYVLYSSVRTPNMEKIQSDMDAGIEVPGAYYQQQAESLSIRRK